MYILLYYLIKWLDPVLICDWSTAILFTRNHGYTASPFYYFSFYFGPSIECIIQCDV